LISQTEAGTESEDVQG